jgi:hypothetical protein
MAAYGNGLPLHQVASKALIYLLVSHTTIIGVIIVMRSKWTMMSYKAKDELMTQENGEPEVLRENSVVIDDTDLDQTVPFVQYEITSYGADIDTEGFVKRLRREDVYIPPFQRDYVWSQREASMGSNA